MRGTDYAVPALTLFLTHVVAGMGICGTTTFRSLLIAARHLATLGLGFVAAFHLLAVSLHLVAAVFVILITAFIARLTVVGGHSVACMGIDSRLRGLRSGGDGDRQSDRGKQNLHVNLH